MASHTWAMHDELYTGLFHDGGPYLTETSPLICSANPWTCLYMIGTFVMKELKFFRETKLEKKFLENKRFYLSFPH